MHLLGFKKFAPWALVAFSAILGSAADKRHKKPLVYDFSLVQPSGANALIYEDPDINVTFHLQGDGWITFQVSNKTNSIVRLIWSEAAFSDTKGESSKLIPGETRRMALDQPQSDAVVLPSSTYSATAFPRSFYVTGLVGYDPGTFWIASILAWPHPHSRCCDDSTIQNQIGKTFQVYLPFVIGEAKRGLTSKFEVTSARFVD